MGWHSFDFVDDQKTPLAFAFGRRILYTPLLHLLQLSGLVSSGLVHRFFPPFIRTKPYSAYTKLIKFVVSIETTGTHYSSAHHQCMGRLPDQNGTCVLQRSGI